MTFWGDVMAQDIVDLTIIVLAGAGLLYCLLQREKSAEWIIAFAISFFLAINAFAITPLS